MKRFYKRAGTTPVEGGFAVTLDERPIRTPARRLLKLPTDALAKAIAAEWDSQGETITQDGMPLTRLACTAIDRVAEQRGSIVDEIASYGTTDLVCYRADRPAELVRRQERAWQPLLDWLAERFGARLVVTTGVVPIDQPARPLNALKARIATLDDMRLTALHGATQACGSVVIALALLEGRLDAETAFEASQIDEGFQVEQWGDDAALSLRRAALKAEIAACASFMELCGS